MEFRHRWMEYKESRHLWEYSWNRNLQQDLTRTRNCNQLMVRWQENMLKNLLWKRCNKIIPKFIMSRGDGDYKAGISMKQHTHSRSPKT